MKRCLIYVSLLILLTGTGTSCSPRIHSERATLPEIIPTDHATRKFNLQLDFMKRHFSGMLIARRMENDEIRLVFGSYFGLSIFDFSLSEDSLRINSCVEPMRKKKVLRLLEHDFKQLFLPTRDARVKEKSSTFEKRTTGKGMAKAIISLSGFTDGRSRRVQIKHPWIRLKIQLDRLETNKPQ